MSFVHTYLPSKTTEEASRTGAFYCTLHITCTAFCVRCSMCVTDETRHHNDISHINSPTMSPTDCRPVPRTRHVPVHQEFVDSHHIPPSKWVPTLPSHPHPSINIGNRFPYSPLGRRSQPHQIQAAATRKVPSPTARFLRHLTFPCLTSNSKTSFTDVFP